MEISITVTKDCNLQCKYCYQGKHIEKIQISFETIKKIVELIKDKLIEYNDSSLDIVFIGGEPLLAYKKIIQIAELLNANLSNVVIKYYITTNGTVLNDEILTFLTQKKVDVSVSIDGNQNIHDRYRVDKQNRGTYKKVISTIKTLQKNNVKVKARMTITPDSAFTFYEDVVKLFEQNITVINPVCDFTCEWKSTQIDALKVAYRRLADWYIKMVGQVQLTCFDGRLYSLLTRKKLFCNAGIGLHYVISTSGEIYPCNYVTDNPDFLIGNLRKIKEPSEVREMYLEYVLNENIKCKECDANEFCYGQKCCFLNWKTSGYLNSISPIMCQHEQFIFTLLQEILMSLCRTNSTEITKLIQYIDKNKLGNKTYDKLRGKLWNMI